MSDDEIVAKILSTLPKSFEHMETAWDSMPVDDKTLDNLRARLIQEERKIKRRQSESNVPRHEEREALKANYHPPRRDAPNDHPSNKAPFNRSENHQYRPNRYCSVCHRTNHWTRDHRPSKRDRDTDEEQGGSQNKRNKANVPEQKAKNFSMVSIFGLASSSTTNWFADSRATQHMSDQRHLFTNFTSITPGKLTITGIGKKVIYAHGRGDIPIKTKINGQLISGTIKDVLFIPDIGINLKSIPVITELGYKVTFSGSDVEIVHGESLFMVGKRVGQSLYQLDLLTQEKVNAKAAISSGASFDVWHERLAHVNHDTIRKMITSNSVVGLNIIGELSAAPCDPCIIGKMHRICHFQKEEKEQKKLVELSTPMLLR